jgi:hypothetical protein
MSLQLILHGHGANGKFRSFAPSRGRCPSEQIEDELRRLDHDHDTRLKHSERYGDSSWIVAAKRACLGG